jgi:hypothetical protein
MIWWLYWTYFDIFVYYSRCSRNVLWICLKWLAKDQSYIMKFIGTYLTNIWCKGFRWCVWQITYITSYPGIIIPTREPRPTDVILRCLANQNSPNWHKISLAWFPPIQTILWWSQDVTRCLFAADGCDQPECKRKRRRILGSGKKRRIKHIFRNGNGSEWKVIFHLHMFRWTMKPTKLSKCRSSCCMTHARMAENPGGCLFSSAMAMLVWYRGAWLHSKTWPHPSPCCLVPCACAPHCIWLQPQVVRSAEMVQEEVPKFHLLVLCD